MSTREKARTLEVLDSLWTPEEITDDGGVVKVIIEQETDRMHPAVGDTVYFHYTATLEQSGELVYDSRETGEEARITLGVKNTNKPSGLWGIDLGLRQTKIGQTVRLTCTSEYAYGNAGRSKLGIPPKANVIFEVELTRMWDFGETVILEEDGAVYKSLQKAGTGLEHPKIGGLGDRISLVTVFISGHCNGRCFIRNEEKWALGDAWSRNLPDGLDFAIERMIEHECSLIKLTGKWAYGAAGNEHYCIPPNADVLFNVNLKSNAFIFQTFYPNLEKKIDDGERWKALGTRFLKENKPNLALNKFRAVIDLLEVIGGDFREHQARRQEQADRRKKYEERRQQKQMLIDVMGDDYDSEWDEEAGSDGEDGAKKSIFQLHKERQAQIDRGEIEDTLKKPKQKKPNRIVAEEKTNLFHNFSTKNAGEQGFQEDWGELKEKRDDLYRTSQMNAALCCIKAKEGFAAIRHCKRALELNENNPKLYFRMAQAYQLQAYYRKAVDHYKKVLELEPDNKAARLGIKQCVAQSKETMEKQKSTFSKMLPKAEKKKKKTVYDAFSSDEEYYTY